MPIPRKADAVLLTEGKSFAAVIDIAANKLESYTELKKDQAPITETEMHSYDDVLKKDPRIIEALKKRGITDLRLVTCYVTPAGHVDLPEQTEGRRIGWGGCTYSANAKYGWDREIPGVFFVVDMNEKKIARFSDYGAVPMPSNHQHLRRGRRTRAARHMPILTSQPNGPSFTIKDGEITWQNWHFRFRLDPRVGPVVNLVNYQDGAKERSVLYEGATRRNVCALPGSGRDLELACLSRCRRILHQHRLRRHHQAIAARSRLPHLRHILQRNILP